MALSVNWATKVITISQADLTWVSGTLYELDTDQFRKDLKALEASEDGMSFLDTHRHNTAVTVAGTTFARTIEIINGYSVQFLPNSQWSVRLVGSNNNIFDVENGILVQNQVQVIPNNSAGLIGAAEMLALLQNATYGGAVHINSVSGNDANDGTHGSPVETAAAARPIADDKGLDQYHLIGSINLTQAHDRWGFIGDSAAFNDVVNFNNQSVDESRFQGVQLSGDADESRVEALFCELDNPGNLHGVFRQCGLLNNFKVEAITPRVYVFHHCYSQVAGPGRPTLDFTNLAVTHDVQFRNYVGGISVINMVQGNLSLDVKPGTVDLQDTMIGGDAVVRGDGLFINNAGPGVNVTDGFQNWTDTHLAHQIAAGKAIIAPDDLSVQIFDRDLVTVLKTLTRSADGRTRTPV